MPAGTVASGSTHGRPEFPPPAFPFEAPALPLFPFEAPALPLLPLEALALLAFPFEAPALPFDALASVALTSSSDGLALSGSVTPVPDVGSGAVESPEAVPPPPEAVGGDAGLG